MSNKPWFFTIAIFLKIVRIQGNAVINSIKYKKYTISLFTSLFQETKGGIEEWQDILVKGMGKS